MVSPRQTFQSRLVYQDVLLKLFWKNTKKQVTLRIIVVSQGNSAADKLKNEANFHSKWEERQWSQTYSLGDQEVLNEIAWPPQSPTLNIIKCVWDDMKRQKDLRKHVSTEYMRLVLKDVSNNIQKLCARSPRRIDGAFVLVHATLWWPKSAFYYYILLVVRWRLELGLG